MANIKKKRNKKQTQLLLALLGAVVGGGALFLFLSKDSGSSVEYGTDPAVLQANIERKNKAIKIRRDLFEERMLDSLNSYIPIQEAEDMGRPNPFTPYPAIVQDPPADESDLVEGETPLEEL